MTSEDTDGILARARARGRAKNLPYAGEVTPEEAYQLQNLGAARIVDVRTRFEAEYVGRIDGTPLVEWKALGSPGPNQAFLEELAALDLKGTKIMFLCRSGVRSHAAAKAAAEVGYHDAFNILEGFEGDLNAQKQRGSQGGWRHHGLPWIQG